MRLIALTNLFGYITKVIISALLIFLGFGIFGPLLGFSFCFVVIFLTRLLSIPFRGKTLPINKKQIVMNYALPALISIIAWIIFLNGQYVVLTALTNPEVTGIFTVAMLVSTPIAVFPTTLSTALFPIISHLSTFRGSKEKQGYLLGLVLRYALFFTLPIAIFLVVFSEPLILFFSSEEFLSASKIFPLVALASIFYGLGYIFFHNIYALGKPKTQRNIVIIATLTLLSASVIFSPKLLELGQAFSYTISTAVLLTLGYFFTRKYTKIKLHLSNIVKLIPAILVSLAFLYFASKLTVGLVVNIFLVAIYGLIYLLILIPLRFYKKEDITIMQYIASRIPFFKKQILYLAKLLLKFT